MGINSDWPKVWKDERSAFIADKIPRDTSTIFIDGQILLMQSKSRGQKTWRDFALNFSGTASPARTGALTTLCLPLTTTA